MQIILNTPPKNVVSFAEHNFSTDKFYGVQMPNGRGFVRRENYNNGKFAPYCINGFTYCNFWDSYQYDSIAEVVRALLNRHSEIGKIQVHVFDTFAELAKFLVDGAA